MTFTEWWYERRGELSTEIPSIVAVRAWAGGYGHCADVMETCIKKLRDELGDRDAEIEKLTRRVAELERPVNPPDPPEPRRRDIRREYAALQIFCALIISGRSSDLNIRGADTIAREFLEYMDKEVHNEHV